MAPKKQAAPFSREDSSHLRLHGQGALQELDDREQPILVMVHRSFGLPMAIASHRSSTTPFSSTNWCSPRTIRARPSLLMLQATSSWC